MHELQKNEEIVVIHMKLSENLADTFTKLLPASTFEKHTNSYTRNNGRCLHRYMERYYPLSLI